MYRLFLLS